MKILADRNRSERGWRVALPLGQRVAKAFTLLEVVLGLIILSLFTGTLFAVIRTAVASSAEMQRIQIENDQVNQFIRLCRQAFQNLPSTAGLTLKVTQPGTPAIEELTITGAPECFSFGPVPISYQDTVISTIPNTDATNASSDGSTVYDVSITRQDILPPDANQGAMAIQSTSTVTTDDQGRTWMPMLPNVASLSWRFYQDDDAQWQEEWDNTKLPMLVEMNLQIAGRSVPMRVVFTVPGTVVAGANANLVPPPTAAAGGGDDGGGGRGRRGGRDRDGKDKRDGKDGKREGKGGKDDKRGGKGRDGSERGTNATKSDSKTDSKSESKSDSKGESSKSSSSSKSGGGSSGKR